jgi:hypothetical protein
MGLYVVFSWEHKKENSMVVEVGWMVYYMVVSWADETAFLKAALSA